jgi:hypothetical protein
MAKCYDSSTHPDADRRTMKEPRHHNLVIYTESAWKRIPVLIMLWAYFLYYSIGRVTYIRKYPNITTDDYFTTMNQTYYGCVRFSTTRPGFKWISSSTYEDDPHRTGFSGYYPLVNTQSDKV